MDWVEKAEQDRMGFYSAESAQGEQPLPKGLPRAKSGAAKKAPARAAHTGDGAKPGDKPKKATTATLAADLQQVLMSLPKIAEQVTEIGQRQKTLEDQVSDRLASARPQFLDLWAHLCRSRRIIFYIDNDGALYSLMQGYSSSPGLSLLSRMLAVRLEELVCIQWFARAASASSLADYPSRGMAHELLPCDIVGDTATTLRIFDKCADEFLVGQNDELGLGQVANKTNGSFSNVRRSKRKLFHGMSSNSNLTKSVKKNAMFSCVMSLVMCFAVSMSRRIGDVTSI